MFRLYKTGHDITLSIAEGEEPPRPSIPARKRALAKPSAIAPAEAVQYDGGIAPDRIVRFVSTENVGLLLWATAEAIQALYEAGGGFSLDTDLLGPPGAVTRTYDCLWDESVVPEFTPAAHGQRWYMDLVIRLREVA